MKERGPGAEFHSQRKGGSLFRFSFLLVGERKTYAGGLVQFLVAFSISVFQEIRSLVFRLLPIRAIDTIGFWGAHTQTKFLSFSIFFFSFIVCLGL